MEQERTLSYTMAHKLDEAELEKVAGGSSSGTMLPSYSPGSDSDISFDL